MIFDCIRRFHFPNDNLEDGYSVTFLVFEHNKIKFVIPIANDCTCQLSMLKCMPAN